LPSRTARRTLATRWQSTIQAFLDPVLVPPRTYPGDPNHRHRVASRSIVVAG